MGLFVVKVDIYLEVDIYVMEGNKNGFGVGEWMLYLIIVYILVNIDIGVK